MVDEKSPDVTLAFCCAEVVALSDFECQFAIVCF